jgi:endonuclease/exonuclease/phosphatase family metal-dependent hydrolase
MDLPFARGMSDTMASTDGRVGYTPSIFEDPVDELLHPELGIWRANVGEPVALDLARGGSAVLDGLDVLCWNVAVGAGRLGVLLDMLRSGAFGGRCTNPRRPLVVLLQEAYRTDSSIPSDPSGRFHGGALQPANADDVVGIARAFDLSLRYAPSMRNGADRSDRGNAILSTIPFGVSHAFVLPYVKQRRVAVSAELDGVAGLTLISAHLDTGGQPREGRRWGAFGRGRVAQVNALVDRLRDGRNEHSLLVGADLNTQLGLRDPVIRALVNAGMHAAARIGPWRHTYHGPMKMMLDHLLFRPGRGQITRVRVSRLDERPGDAGWRVFGSDHHPLLAQVDFREPVHRR